MIRRIPWLALALTSVMASVMPSVSVGQQLPTEPVSNTTLATFAVFGAEVVYDGVTTRVLSQRAYGEGDPLAQPFVRAGVPGQVAGGLLAAGATGMAWFVLHRTHHEGMAKWFLLSVVAAEGGNDVRQFDLLCKS